MKLHVDLRKGEKNSAIRKEGNIPAVVYGKHMTAPLNIICKKNDFIKKFKEAGYSTPLTLEGEGVDQFVLIHDMQLDPVSDFVLHADFLAVNKDEKVTAEVPVILVGESPLEKLGEGKIQLLKDYVEVEDILAFAKEKNEHPFLIILDEIQDVHNFGSILRTADAVGVHGVIIGKRRSVSLNSIVAKTSAGAVEYVKVARVSNIASTIEILKKAGVWVVGTDSTGGGNYYKADLKGPIALV
ncbi:MAG: 50S ribosomal protein L25, partial [bacterium]